MKNSSDKNAPDGKFKPSRRELFKLVSAASAGALVGAASINARAASNGGVSSQTFSLFEKEYETIDDMYDISKDISRFDQKYTALMRGMWDEEVRPSTISYGAKKAGLVPFAQEGTPGYSKVDWALHWAAMAGTNTCAPLANLGVRGAGNYNDWSRHANPTYKRQIFEDKAEISKQVKRAARFLGASLAGIAPYDERWTYSKWFDIDASMTNVKTMEIQHDKLHETEAVFPFEPKSVIALAFEMDYNALQAPGFISGAAPALAYSDMPEVAFKVAEFLNLLGYKSIPTGNDTGMSVPISVQAWLSWPLTLTGLLGLFISSGLPDLSILHSVPKEAPENVPGAVIGIGRKIAIDLAEMLESAMFTPFLIMAIVGGVFVVVTYREKIVLLLGRTRLSMRMVFGKQAA